MILGAFGPWQFVLILVVVLLLFGGRKIPELMKGLGQGMKDASKGSNPSKEGESKQETTTEEK